MLTNTELTANALQVGSIIEVNSFKDDNGVCKIIRVQKKISRVTKDSVWFNNSGTSHLRRTTIDADHTIIIISI